MWLREFIIVAVVGLGPAIAHADDTPDRYRDSYAHEAQGKYAEALEDIDGMSSSQRKTYVYQLRRGWLLYLLGRHWDSIEAYRAAIALKPKAVEPRLGLMLPEMALLMWLDAIATGKTVLELDPLNYLANSRMAWANYSLGRYGDVEALYRKLLGAYPSDYEMRAGLGWSLLKQGEYAAALSEFDAVLTIAPDYATAQEGRKAARVGMG